MYLEITRPIRILPWLAIACGMLTPGCSSSNARHGLGVNDAFGNPPTTGFGQAARLGGAAQIASPSGDATMVASGFIIAKYQATEIQRRIGEERARRAYHKMLTKEKARQANHPIPLEKPTATKAKRSRYIAVDVPKDHRFKGRKAIMIWDTQSESLVGNQVYDVATPPPVGSSVKFDTYASQYVGNES